MFGEFNDLLYDSDKMGQNSHPQSLMDGFHASIEYCRLNEIDLEGENFTWEKSKGSPSWVRECLDRSFATHDWWQLFPLCKLYVSHTIVSDHDPIRLELCNVMLSRKKFCFRFENQSAFVPGRSISDNVLIAFEVLHFMKRKNHDSKGEVALKLDISKAYDLVDWNYLQKRMYDMGFAEKFIRWILLCVTIVEYTICFNNENVGPIYPKRGLRQGDPLSPYLFLLYVEGLSDALSNAATENHIHGCKISLSAPL